MTDTDKPPEERRVNLKDIEPLRPVPDDEPVVDEIRDVDRVGPTAAAAAGSTPAVGVSAETIEEPPHDDDGLDELRRG
jgi:hypothetical protein